MAIDAVPPDAGTMKQLHAARLAEKRQALFYRSLAAAAEDANDADLSERMNGMHADEQHHLSRLTVRLVEFGEPVEDLGAEPSPVARLASWERDARVREMEEIERYELLIRERLDARTRTMIEEFLVAERAHADTLGGKWMRA
jgi:rubrerythrin